MEAEEYHQDRPGSGGEWYIIPRSNHIGDVGEWIDTWWYLAQDRVIVIIGPTPAASRHVICLLFGGMYR
jgi:hypothetical protein